MNVLTALAVPAMLFAAGHAAAQPAPSPHEQHRQAGQRPATQTEKGCCCDEKMRQMMMEMMRKHQQGGTPQPKSKTDRQAPAGGDHQHDG